MATHSPPTREVVAEAAAAHGPSLALLVRLAAPFLLLWRNRGILVKVTRNDLRGRYAGSVLGFAWIGLYPLLFLGVYSVVYLFVLKVRLGDQGPLQYVGLIFCGLVPFLAFSESLGMGVGSVVANANLVKNTLFPIELVPVKAVLMSQATQFVGFMLLTAFLLVCGRITPWAMLVPVIWAAQLLFFIGLIWILSSLNVLFRDLQNLVTMITLLLMMVSPIGYTEEMIPASLRPFLAANPLYYLIVAYQDAFAVGQYPRHHTLSIFVAISVVTFLVGHWLFSRLKPVFADSV